MFEISAYINDENFAFGMRKVISKCKNSDNIGSGVSFSLIEKNLKKAYGMLAFKLKNNEKMEDYEICFYDNYYKIISELNSIKALKNSSTKLPHSNSVPNIYWICNYIVSSCCGAVCQKRFTEGINEYSSVLQISSDEIFALNDMLKYCLIEYLTIFARKIIVNNTYSIRAKKDICGDKININLLKYGAYANEVVNSNMFSLSGENRDKADLSSIIGEHKNSMTDYMGMLNGGIICLHNIKSWYTTEYALMLSQVMRYIDEVHESFEKNTTATKSLYLECIGKIAKKKNSTEKSVVKNIYSSINQNDNIVNHILPKKKGDIFCIATLICCILSSALLSFVICLFTSDVAILIVSFLLFIPIFKAYIENKVLKFKSGHISPEVTIGLKERNSTAVVYTMYVRDINEVRNAIENMLTIKVSNSDYDCGLLLDAPASIVDQILKEVRKAGLSVAVRRVAYERKRGAILQFNEYLLSGKDDNFSLIIGFKGEYKYVITLDADSMMVELDGLVRTMEHPYANNINILTLPMQADPQKLDTRFSRLFCGSVGQGQYMRACDYGDIVYGKGNYTGKGIIRIKEFNQLLGNTFQDNRILSHDMIEGAFAGCSTYNQSGFDEFPHSYSEMLNREMRWFRGDTQLLPFVCSKIKDKNGLKRKNDIGIYYKSQILYNIYVKLCYVISFICILLLPFTSFPVLIFCIAYCRELISILVSFGLLFVSTKKMGQNIAINIVNIIALPTLAVKICATFLTAIIRLITQKKLLEWTTSLHSKNRMVYFVPNYLLAIYLCFVCVVFQTTNTLFFVTIAVLYCLSFLVQIYLTGISDDEKLSQENVEFVLDLMKRTWLYYESMPTYILPPDNYSEHKGWADRSSPTDIAMNIVACVVAYENKILTYKEYVRRLMSLISGVEKLTKYKGLPYNWHTASDCKPLMPLYVSSVDCGNLLASLILVSNEDCVKNRALKLIEEMDFSVLFDSSRRLLYIGYNDSTKQFDSSHYDLAGSEILLTYLLCVSCGKLPVESYNNLSHYTLKGQGGCLASWTGGLFEYTLPLLFLKPSKNTLYSENMNNVVRTHICDGRKNKFDIWGRSESLFSTKNENDDFSYTAFGCTEIALSNKIMRNVVAPYATATALVADKTNKAKILNLISKYVFNFGLPDAVDFKSNTIIESFMTHHQGMVMAGLEICLNDSVRKRMDNSPIVRNSKYRMNRSAELLSQSVVKHSPYQAIKRYKQKVVNSSRELPQLALLTNGKYSVVIEENGNGYSRYDNIIMNRFDRDGGIDICSNGASLMANANFSCRDGVASFKKQTSGIMSNIFVSVLPDINCERRSINLKNISDKEVVSELVVSFIPCIRPQMEDIAHKAFSSLFIDVKNNVEYISASRNDKDFVALKMYCNNVEYNGSEQNERRGTGVKFGKVVFPKLYAKKKIILSPNQSVCMDVFIGYGKSLHDFDFMYKRVATENYNILTAGKIQSIYNQHKISYMFTELASHLLYRGSKKNGKNIGVVLYVNSEKKLMFEIKQLCLLSLFGFVFEVVIVYTKTYLNAVNLAMNICSRSNINARGFDKAITDKHFLSKVIDDCIDPYNTQNRKITDIKINIRRAFDNAVLNDEKYIYQLGLGGFTKNGYALTMPKNGTPSAWSNIIANDEMGCVMTASGGGFTFAKNSYKDKLTYWSGYDFDSSISEGVILSERNVVWSITRYPCEKMCQYNIVHNIGSTVFKCNYNGIIATQKVYLDKHTKYYDIELFEKSGKTREVNALFFADLVLGDFIQNTSRAIMYDIVHDGILANNGKLSLYMQSNDIIMSNAYYKQAIMRNGKYYVKHQLGNIGYTPCLSIRVQKRLEANSSCKFRFALSASEVEWKCESKSVDELFKNANFNVIKSDENPHGLYLQWLYAQVYHSRFMGRCGYFQVSGAYGFRDQLQDCMTLMYGNPKLVKEHIINCAKHQFLFGDVMHWWHEELSGVRTTICDDRLYLPWVVCEYIEKVGDADILNIETTYLKDIDLPEGNSSIYAEFENSEIYGSIHEHSLKAIFSVGLSPRGLVLMGGGDWNDGMDKVGEKGQGESVWASMFLYFVAKKYMGLCNEVEHKLLYNLCDKLQYAVRECFSGDRYTRAITDDGYVLGIEQSIECKIDLLVQSWATLSGIVDKKSADKALDTAYSRLVDEKNGIIKLLDPPFEKLKVGYISNYPKGVRENGGQYSHAAAWFVRALYVAGKYEKAEKLLEMMFPSSHTMSSDDVEKYRLEPYVMSADVYAGELAGQGGWSWYTGSASWMYRNIFEFHYGIKIKQGLIAFEPRMIGKANLHIEIFGTKFSIVIERESYYDSINVNIDGINYAKMWYKLSSLNGRTVVVT